MRSSSRPRPGGPRPGGGGRGWGGGGGGLVLGTGVALAVVAVAVLGLRHRAPAPSSSPPSATPGVAALKAKLAVLRRPQTAADRTYPGLAARGGRNPVIGNLTRLAATVGSARVYVLVIKPQGKTPPFAVASVVDKDGRFETTSAPVIGARFAPNQVRAGELVRGLGQDPNRGFTIGIVPDGVRQVEWTFTGARYGVLNANPISVATLARSNVAVTFVHPGQGPLARAVWYDAAGKVVASAGPSAESKRELTRIEAVNASRNRPVDPELIAHYRLFRSVAPIDLARSPVLATVGGGGSGDLNYWQTRYIGSVTGLDGRGLWITPGTHDLCISDWTAGACTAPLSRRDDAGILGGTTSNGGETTIPGLVPDGNGTVTFVLADGSRKTFPVIDNVFEATVRGRAVARINRDIHGRVVRTQIG